MRIHSIRTRTAVALIPALLAGTMHAQAIGIRSDTQYAGGFAPFYDRDNNFAPVANIMRRSGGSSPFANHCTGTLINARTIITAAHCVVQDDNPDTNIDLGDQDPARNGERTFGISFQPDSDQSGESYQDAVNGFRENDDESLISGFVAYQGYGLPVNPGGTTNDSHDIALISLDKPITDITPAELLQLMPNAGEEITLVGYGAAGAIDVDVTVEDGETSPSLADNRRRIGGNYLDIVTPLTAELVNQLTNNNPQMMANFELGKTMLIFDSDDPNDPRDLRTFQPSASDPLHEDEATTAPGDSGGPIFVVRNGRRYLVGLSNSGGPRVPNSYDGGYNNIIFHTPVASHLDWIARNNPLKEVSAKIGTWNWSDSNAWHSINTASGPQTVAPENNTTTTCNDGEKGYCLHSTYFNVTMDQATNMTVDRDVTIDQLTIDHANAVTTVASGRTLATEIATIVKNGQLRMNADATIEGEGVRVENGALLTGMGTIDGELDTSGVVALTSGQDEVVGTLHVTDDVTFRSGSRFRVRMNRHGQTDMLRGAAAISISGATAEIVPSSELYQRSVSYNILVSDTTPIQGSFDSVTSTSLFYDASLTTAQDMMSIGVTMDRTMTRASRLSKEQKILDLLTKGLDRGHSDVQELFTLVRDVPEAQLDATLRSLNGNMHANNSTALLGSLNAVSSVLAQLRQSTNVSSNGTNASFVRSYASQPKRTAAQTTLDGMTGVNDAAAHNETGYWSGWFKGLAGRGHYDGSGSNASTTTNTYGMLGGFFYTAPELAQVGIYGGFTETTGDQSGDSTNVQSIVVGLNGEMPFGDYTFGGFLQYSNQSYTSSRSVLTGGTTRRAKADYDGHVFSASLEATRTVTLMQNVNLTPYLGLEGHIAQVDGYTETGAGVANLTVASKRDHIVFSNIGGRLETTIQRDGVRLTPQLDLGWRAEIVQPKNGQTATLAGQALDIRGNNRSRHALKVGVGFQMAFDKGPILETRYDGALSSNFQDHNASVRLTIPFR